MENLISQILALVTFFAFPVVQYLILRAASRKEGQPELWYLPRYGFRLVVRNNSGKRVLKDIRYTVNLIRSVPASEGCDIATADSRLIFHNDKLYLFPKSDLIILSFKLLSDNGTIRFVRTDKFGIEKASLSIEEFGTLRCDYAATIHNFFNFHVQIGKRVTIKSSELQDIARAIKENGKERAFELKSVRTVA